MSKAFSRWFMSKLVNEGSRSSVIENAAKKAVELEKTGGEKLGLWLGAAFAEVSQDVNTLLGKGGDGQTESALKRQEETKGNDQHPGSGSGSSRQPMTSSGQSYVRALRDAESPASAFAIVESALADPSVFLYGSLLLCPGFRMAQKQATTPADTARGGDLAAVLHLMSYGTIADLHSEAEPSSSNVPADVRKRAVPLLTEGLVDKLRQLSVLSFYTKHANGRSDIPYGELEAYIRAKDSAAMEAVVVAAVSSHLLKARMDPQRGIVHFVELLQVRDVSPGEIAALREKLKAWGLTCNRQLKQLDRAMDACDASDARMEALLR